MIQQKESNINLLLIKLKYSANEIAMENVPDLLIAPQPWLPTTRISAWCFSTASQRTYLASPSTTSTRALTCDDSTKSEYKNYRHGKFIYLRIQTYIPAKFEFSNMPFRNLISVIGTPVLAKKVTFQPKKSLLFY